MAPWPTRPTAYAPGVHARAATSRERHEGGLGQQEQRALAEALDQPGREHGAEGVAGVGQRRRVDLQQAGSSATSATATSQVAGAAPGSGEGHRGAASSGRPAVAAGRCASLMATGSPVPEPRNAMMGAMATGGGRGDHLPADGRASAGASAASARPRRRATPRPSRWPVAGIPRRQGRAGRDRRAGPGTGVPRGARRHHRGGRPARRRPDHSGRVAPRAPGVRGPAASTAPRSRASTRRSAWLAADELASVPWLDTNRPLLRPLGGAIADFVVMNGL